MSQRRLIRVAALNNAEWCDAFCRTHGIVGRFQADYWFSPVRTPRYYPDAVTLLPEITLEHVLSGIETSEACSVKDSFTGLDLAAAGFRPLFRAHWLTREPADSRVRSARGWSVLTTAEQLGEWEAAWAGLAEGGSDRGPTTQRGIRRSRSASDPSLRRGVVSRLLGQRSMSLSRAFAARPARALAAEPCRRASPGVAVRRAYRRCVRNVSACSTSRQQQSADLQALYRSPLTDSNRRPPPYHGGALPTELRGQAFWTVAKFRPGSLPAQADLVSGLAS